MKKLKYGYLTLIFLVIGQYCSAQWVQLNSGTTTYLTSVFFTNEDVGIAVGQDGTILKTIDGGLTWNSKNSGTTEHLCQVLFVDNNIGFVVGVKGTILKTDDSGETWYSKSFATPNTLYSISFCNETKGVAVGSNATILMTDDQGETWTREPSLEILGDTTYSINTIKFASESIGYCGGGQSFTSSLAILMKTEDSGDTWDIIYLNEGGDPVEICSLFPVNEDRIWAIGFAYPQTYGPWLVYSNDGGANITLIGWPPFPFKPNSWSDGIFFTNILTGYMASEGAIISTKDGGISWQENEFGFWEPLDAIFFVNENIGYAVGFNGIIMKTINGGGLVGIENQKATHISVYPNPNAGRFVVRVADELALKKLNIKIVDLLGKNIGFNYTQADNHNFLFTVESPHPCFAYLIIETNYGSETTMIYRSKIIIN